ncbi:uncharacterized protein LOC111442799 [Cucurbita moschata]|uniref:Uncharacterized protein LOC111442799 n=1 Tax=Cucurbita moschata TaxID=3662 RepID=A0A6J1F7B9_CUCMO|nr:uncharacterized protein LOC111442799 [Cucurbita moschata]
MNNVKLDSSFFATQLHSSLYCIKNGNFVCVRRGRLSKRDSKKYICAKHNDWNARVDRFSRFCGQHLKSISLKLRPRHESLMKCANEPSVQTKALSSFLRPLRNEGLFLIRCSAFVAVVSGICLLVWYGQTKAKGFVEAKLLPSVCKAVSDCIQRDLDFGKVRSISPLSITLESCSVGPDDEEFSCGEVPTMKLRVLPFTSLRRGRVIIDVVLSHPSAVVVQKRDYTWLGLPFPSEGTLQRHSSSEEGIDNRTKIRRIAREEAAACWSKDRDDAAREAAEMGFVVSDRSSGLYDSSNLKEDVGPAVDVENSKAFLFMDENVHSREHRCMDTDVDYKIKHANAEKYFDVKSPGSRLKFLSRVMKVPIKGQSKRKASGDNVYVNNFMAKKRILRRSTLAAQDYFKAASEVKFSEPSELHRSLNNVNLDAYLVKSVNETNADSSVMNTDAQYGKQRLYAGLPSLEEEGGIDIPNHIDDQISTVTGLGNKDRRFFSVTPSINESNVKNDDVVGSDHIPDGISDQMCHTSQAPTSTGHEHQSGTSGPTSFWAMSPKSALSYFPKDAGTKLLYHLAMYFKNLKFGLVQHSRVIVNGGDVMKNKGTEAMLPVTIDSVHFKGGTLMLLAYGDREPREMENVNGHVKFQNHYGNVHVHLSGNCKTWRSDSVSGDGGWLSADVFVDIFEQQWHSNLKITNLFVPLFERILDIPITWSKGRATGEVHLCMSRGDTFPNFQGQLEVTGLAFKIFDAPSSFTEMAASLCFRGQRIFVQNASGWFGSAPLEASGDFGIHPEEGEFHLMCQVPCVEVNALMKTFKMRPFLFPLAGSVTAVFNCQGPLDSPIFVGSGMVSRKMNHSISDIPASCASEAIVKSKEAGAIAAVDRIPFSYVSANFTFNIDNCVADLYGIRANLVDGGEIRGAGNAWICPEGELDDTAMDLNISGNISFDKIMHRYMPGYLDLMPLKLGLLNGETKVSGSLTRPRFNINWTAPLAEGSFRDARGDINISHDYFIVNSSSVAFELFSKMQTSYSDENMLDEEAFDAKRTPSCTIDGVELDLHMRGFEFLSLVSYIFESPRPTHLKATGRVKFVGKVLRPSASNSSQDFNTEKSNQQVQTIGDENKNSLAGEVSISGLKLNQLILAPKLAGQLSMTRESIKLDATGRPDESLSVEIVGSLKPGSDNSIKSKLFSFNLQRGQLRANVCYQPFRSAHLELRHLPLDDLELASLRGAIQRAEIELNLQKRRGHGVLSVLGPKFSGVLGEALDIAARWSGDVITIEKTILEQSNSRYELQGEYVLPGSRDRNVTGKETHGFLKKAMASHLSSVISSMGRWRMRLEVPRAEVAEMLPLARLLSRSTDPSVHSRSKDLFIQSLQAVGLYTESVQELIEVIRRQFILSDEIVLEDLSLPGLSELRGCWRGSLDASGGGNGDTMAEFDFHGEDWEWGTYKTQRVLAGGAYSNNDGLRLEKIFIQKDNATIHADGTLFGPITNLHFAVLNFPVSLVPTVVQVIESSAKDLVHSLRQLVTPIRGILHMEGDLRGNLAKPECDVQVRLLDGAIGGIDLGRAEVVASLTSSSRLLFNAKFEPIIQNGHVHVQGSIPVLFFQNSVTEVEELETDTSRATLIHAWGKEKVRDKFNDRKSSRERNEEGWNTQLAEGLKGLNWNLLDVGEVRVDADIKDGGMLLLTALSPHVNWLHGNADILLQVKGTIEEPVLDGSASFHRASISSPVLPKPLINFGGTVHVRSNRLCINSLESRVSRRGKLIVKGNLPLRSSEASLGDKIDLKCEVLEVRAKNIFSGQVDSQMQITGSILQPNISGNIQLSRGEAYLPHDKGSGAASFNKVVSDQFSPPTGSSNQVVASKYASPFFSSESTALKTRFDAPRDKAADSEKESRNVNIKPSVDVSLSDLKLVLGPELRILYPLILNFAVSGELELNGFAHAKSIKPKGTLTFDNGDVNLLATQVRLKREHLNVATFEPENGLDPMLDLALVGSEWQIRIQSRASKWQDKLVVTSTRSVEQDALSPTEAARAFENQLAESILESDGQLALKKLATATLEKLMPRIEGKGEFGQARWRLVYAPQIPSLLSFPTTDPLKSLTSNISFGTVVEVQLGKRIQASIVRQMKESEMAMQWTFTYKLTSRLRMVLQSGPAAPAQRTLVLVEYSASSLD